MWLRDVIPVELAAVVAAQVLAQLLVVEEQLDMWLLSMLVVSNNLCYNNKQ